MSENDTGKEAAVCEFCRSSEDERPIFKAKFKGNKLYVCAKCLPGLIHG